MSDHGNRQSTNQAPPIGARFGEWSVLSYSHEIRDRRNRSIHFWNCVCRCGTERTVRADSLKYGNSISCGCVQKRAVVRTATTHGQSYSPEYRNWTSMIQRCHNPNYSEYRNYGARGISVCERWRTSFVAFIEDMGTRPSPSHTVDRIDNEKGYDHANCRWANRKQQNRNKRTNRVLTYRGKSQSVVEWSEELGFSQTMIDSRLRRGWSVEHALSAHYRQKAPAKYGARAMK